MKGDSTHEHGKIYHVTNARMCDGASVPGDTIKRVSLPQRTMQSMLNRITINCINSKNSEIANIVHLHTIVACIGPAAGDLVCSSREHPPFPTRRRSIHKIYRFYEGSSGKVATYHIVIFYFLARKLRHLCSFIWKHCVRCVLLFCEEGSI